MRTKEALTKIAKAVKLALIEFGFVKGLRRWHYYGDCPTHGKASKGEEPCRCPRGYHPHLNYLLEGGYLAPKRMETLKRLIYQAVGMKVMVNYHYTDNPMEMMHHLKYVTRPTFLDRSWDNDLADQMYNARTTQSFGKWDGPTVWSLEQAGEALPPEIQQLNKGFCPSCAKPIHWHKEPIPSIFLVIWGSVVLGMSYHAIIGMPVVLPGVSPLA